MLNIKMKEDDETQNINKTTYQKKLELIKTPFIGGGIIIITTGLLMT
jgi:hypothetical protein